MASMVVRREILVRGHPTEVLSLGQSLDENPKSIILIIPGNPGVASYYVSFMQAIYSHLSNKHAVWTISHAGHCCTSDISFWPDDSHVYNLKDQINHKISFIQDYVPREARITLIGHSIGCHIILKILKSFKPHSEVTIAKNYLLFPTIERMRITPNGERLWPVLSYFRWLVILLTACVFILPERVKEKILRWYFRASHVPDCFFQATIELFHPKVMQNVLWMAFNELVQVCEADIETISKFKSEIVFYYGATDGWCPRVYRDELMLKVEGLHAILCKNGYQHAFVMEHSEPMGEILFEWISS
ncbi:lipid droplet-associated hydrolase [Panulirus ornatus]|uniref:lipid droplet-associated hydrolase n=1 Tax=Panulirus ornatus TaxID=150431 RepID=UPI003A83ACCC